METAQDYDERTPLLRNGNTSNEHGHLCAISESSNEKTSPEENLCFDGHKPPNGSCVSSNGQSPPSEQRTSDSDSRLQGVYCPNTSDEETNEVSLEEIAKALCSAWSHNSKCNFDVNQDYFTTKELYAMHLAWKKVTRGRNVRFPAPTIVEAVAMAVATHLHGPEPPPICDEESHYDLYIAIDKCALTVGLLREWRRITEGVGFPVRYIETVVENPDDQSFDAAELWHRQQVALYDKFHDFIASRRFQCILHTLLIIWPISFIVVGCKYTDCPVSRLLSYLLIGLGCVGILAIFVRRYLMYSMFYAEYSYDWSKEWVGLRFMEFIFLVFIAQVFHFFSAYPMVEPGVKQCAQNLYNAALVLNYVSIPLVFMYLLSYLVIFCANRFDFWRWVFRHL